MKQKKVREKVISVIKSYRLLRQKNKSLKRFIFKLFNKKCKDDFLVFRDREIKRLKILKNVSSRLINIDVFKGYMLWIFKYISTLTRSSN